MIGTEIKYIDGDAVNPHASNMRFILSINNAIGKFSSEFGSRLDNKWRNIGTEYRVWYRSNNFFKLGQIKQINVASDISVFLCLAEDAFLEDPRRILNYEALEECFRRISALAKLEQATIHIPYIGKDLEGYDWEKIEKLLNKHFTRNNIRVFVYSL